jgi:hypothetical protein
MSFVTQRKRVTADADDANIAVTRAATPIRTSRRGHDIDPRNASLRREGVKEGFRIAEEGASRRRRRCRRRSLRPKFDEA